MGHGASIESSNMEGFVETEFQRVKRDPERSYLVRPAPAPAAPGSGCSYR